MHSIILISSVILEHILVLLRVSPHILMYVPQRWELPPLYLLVSRRLLRGQKPTTLSLHQVINMWRWAVVGGLGHRLTFVYPHIVNGRHRVCGHYILPKASYIFQVIPSACLTSLPRKSTLIPQTVTVNWFDLFHHVNCNKRVLKFVCQRLCVVNVCINQNTHLSNPPVWTKYIVMQAYIKAIYCMNINSLLNLIYSPLIRVFK